MSHNNNETELEDIRFRSNTNHSHSSNSDDNIDSASTRMITNDMNNNNNNNNNNNDHDNIDSELIQYAHIKWPFWAKVMIGFSLFISLISLIIGGRALALIKNTNNNNNSNSNDMNPSAFDIERFVQTIAFGSCSSYDFRPQLIWEHGITKSNLDAWIWIGDFVYMDDPPVNCNLQPSSPFCNCTRTWIRKNFCGEGNINNAILRATAQLRHDDYKKFLEYMCPNSDIIPPNNAYQCERSITGTYDDHDYGWNNGDRRLPDKDRYKQLFLDVIGEPAYSNRRNRGRGIEYKYSYNKNKKEEIDVFLLDERFYRMPLPCHIRYDYCKHIIGPNDWDYPWCQDFLYGDNIGSCCKWDDLIQNEWCQDINNQNNELWEEACNPYSKNFGYRSLEFNEDNILQPVAARDTTKVFINDTNIEDAPFCDVLGKNQRAWFQSQLEKSKAPLKVIVSGSVTLNNPSPRPCSENSAYNCTCGSDDFDCYSPAQKNFYWNLQQSIGLNNKKTKYPGCVVIITGDYHFSDIREITPTNSKLSSYLGNDQWQYPIYQVMSSGLTTSTAKYRKCDNTTWTYDYFDTRIGGRCNIITGEPSFGTIRVDWDLPDPLVHLEIRNEYNDVKIHHQFHLSTCTP